MCTKSECLGLREVMGVGGLAQAVFAFFLPPGAEATFRAPAVVEFEVPGDERCEDAADGPGDPMSEEGNEAIDAEKQEAFLQSIAAAMEQESAEVVEAVLRSKSDLPPTGLPLSGDGVVVLRLTRMARSPEVSKVLIESPALVHCHRRVADAGCSVMPPWSPCWLFVPLTQEQLQESSLELSRHHIVALDRDIGSIRSALREIRCKRRPGVSTDHGMGGTTGARAHGHCDADFDGDEPFDALGSRGAPPDDGDEEGNVDVLVQYECAFRTDSSLGAMSC